MRWGNKYFIICKEREGYKMKKMKWFIIIGVVIVVGVLIYFNLIADTSNRTKVNAKEAKYRKLTEKVSASGRIQPQTKVDITSEVTGEIIDLRVNEGDFVNTDELLVVLDTVQLRSDVDQAKYAVSEINARLEGSKAVLDQSKEEFDRQQRLFDARLTSETQYNNAKYDFINAEASYNAASAQAKQASARLEKQLDYLSKAKIVAPMPGIITLLDCEAGEIAPAQTAFTQGKTLMTISNLDIFEVEVEVDETEINKVLLGQAVDIEVDAYPDTVFPGEVVEIGNTALVADLGSQDQSTNFSVKVIFNDPNVKIRPGMSATVDIITNTKEKVLTVSYSAIVMRSLDIDSLERAKSGVESDESEQEPSVSSVQAADKEDEETNIDDVERKDFKGVFVIRDDKSYFVEVSTGIADQKYIEVLSGLEEGDNVVTGPYSVLRSIREDDDIEIIKEDKKDERK
jgi:HlyD family secretion protein